MLPIWFVSPECRSLTLRGSGWTELPPRVFGCARADARGTNGVELGGFLAEPSLCGRFSTLTGMKKILFLLFIGSVVWAQSAGDQKAAEYFRRETERISQRCLADIRSLEDWQNRKPLYRRQLLEMLGLDPLPARTDLKVAPAGRLESDKFTVEKFHFQSMPGLYVTANLFVPKNLPGKAPAILYLCGHSRVVEDGISYGNKVTYQHHPAWFAEHGYVALIIDTLDLGEILGEHHGTYRRGWWWWPTRGYTPAGVETWNAIRALDYLETRPEVDVKRIGVTGRSGGGAYTWFLAGVDDRPAVMVPVAGITDLTNHVVDGTVEGHCDCMFPLNTYGWDFPLLAALCAPRPLLVANSDKDKIFPLDGVQRVHRQLKKIYQLYGAEEKLGLLITDGPHKDTQDLQVPTFRWMDRWLKNEESVISQPAEKRFTSRDLKVFSKIPADQLNTAIHDRFVPSAKDTPVPAAVEEWTALKRKWMELLRGKVLNNWPPPPRERTPTLKADSISNTVRLRLYEFNSDDVYALQLFLLNDARRKPSEVQLRVMDTAEWEKWKVTGDRYFKPLLPPTEARRGINEPELLKKLGQGFAVALIAPRGIGPTAWSGQKDVQIRRRFLLLGQSLETMQARDLQMAVGALKSVPELRRLPVTLQASGTMGVVALMAALLDGSVSGLEIDEPPRTLSEAGSYPNALRFFDLPELMAMMLPRPVTLTHARPADWDWSVKAARVAGGKILIR